METIQQLYDLRGKVIEDQKKMIAKAREEDRGMSADEEATYGKLDERYTELSKAIRRSETLQKREAEEKRLRETQPDPEPESCDSEDPEERAAVAKEKRRREFRAALMSFRPIESRDFSGDSQNIGDNGDGGYIVEDEFVRELLRKASDENAIRGLATVRNTSSGTMTIPYRSSIPSAAQKDEKATYATGNIEFGTTTIDVHKITNSIPVTEEMMTDSAFDIEAEITDALGESIGALEETWFTTGNGTKQAYGVVTGASAGVTAAATDTVTPGELIDLFHALHKKYRGNASWLMEDATIAVIRKLADGNSRFYWNDSLQAGVPDTLLGRPVVTCEAMASIAASAVPIVFGDISKYRVADRAGIRMIRDPYTNATEGVVMITASKRTGGRLPLDEYVKKLTMAAE